MIPQTFTVSSEQIRLYFLVFSVLHFLVVFTVWYIKLIHVGFRAHVKIASRIVSYCNILRNLSTTISEANVTDYYCIASSCLHSSI